MSAARTPESDSRSTHVSPWENLGALVRQHVPSRRIAITDLAGSLSPRVYTYDDLQQMIDSAAQRIAGLGFSRQQRVGILAHNSVEYLALYFAIMAAGQICVPLNVKFARRTIVDILKDANVTMLFRDREHCFPIGDEILCETITLDENSDFWQHYFRKPGKRVPRRFGEGEDGFFLYTSGSTGLPKGVPLSHSGQHWALRQFHVARAEIREHRCLIAAPLYHMNGLWNAKVSLEMGGHAVILPRFEVETFAKAITEQACTWITSVPTMLAILVQRKDLYADQDFGHVTRVTMGSAPITGTLWNEVQALFPNARLFNAYGTTEHGAATFGEHPDGLTRPPLSIGYPTADTRVALRGGDRRDKGVLHVKGPANARGYHHRPEATAQRFCDGWYDTGDVMRRDAIGFYFFEGRADDMFNCGGENVYPGEVEALLERHADVRQACIVPVPYGAKGEAPFAFVVHNPSSSLSKAELKAYALENGPAFMHPRGIAFLDELPLIGTNKIDRTSLKSRARGLMGK